jgi:hypothetical protein
MSCTDTRALFPLRMTEPSMSASTPRSRAISGSGLLARRYRMADVREVTYRAASFKSSSVSASVIPSAK